MAELENLAKTIRQDIIDSISENGGHLASNLGIIELTIAIHYVFDIEFDDIIFDVGHQSYTHKILTGRYDSFKSIRQFNSISGFPNSDESKYDSFIGGHAGVALSASMGMAENKFLNKSKSQTIAIVGDGAMGCGIALEALNNILEIQGKVIVILNDNKMSISNNVGSISHQLNKIISDSWYLKSKNRIKLLLQKSPKPLHLYELSQYLIRTLKNMILPNGTIFSEFGLNYLGPIDGYSFSDLIRTLEAAKNRKHSTLIHVVTEKGHGYEYARSLPEKFHGIGAFHKSNGLLKNKSNMNFSKAFGEVMVELTNPNLVAITAGMKSGTSLEKYAEKNPTNFYDVGIAEEHAVTFAAGMAKKGDIKSVVAIYSTFIQRALDCIYHDVCLQNLNVIFAIDRAGIVDDGPTHHGIYDLGFLQQMPNLMIMAPATENELRFMMHKAMQCNSPVAIRYGKNPSDCEFDTTLPIENIEIGKAKVEANGKKISLWALGSEVARAKKIREELAKELNIDIEVVNIRFVAPFDEKLLLEKAKTHKIITMEDHVINGGISSTIGYILARNSKSFAHAFGWTNQVTEHGNINKIREKHQLDINSIKNKIKEIILEENE